MKPVEYLGVLHAREQTLAWAGLLGLPGLLLALRHGSAYREENSRAANKDDDD